MKEILAEIPVAPEMTQGEAGNDIEITLFQPASLPRTQDIAFPVIDIIDPEIRTDHIGIIPFLVKQDLVRMQQGENMTQ
jgi:hypothetical protein